MVQKSLVRVKHGNVKGSDLYEGEERLKGTFLECLKMSIISYQRNCLNALRSEDIN